MNQIDLKDRVVVVTGGARGIGYAVAVMWLVCSIVAMVKAWHGESYRYPFTLRLLG